MRRILSNDDNDLIQQLKSTDILDVVSWISKACNDIDQITIVKSWCKLLDHTARTESNLAKIEENYYREKIEYEDSKLLSLLPKVPGCESIDKNDISDWMAEDNETETMTENNIV